MGPATGTSQEYLFETIDISDGLAQSSVSSVAKDKDGFIWFGTEDGLDRYDGISFKSFRYDPHDSTSINSSSIMALLVSSKGDLWIGTYNSGISRYDYETENFIHYPIQLNDSLIINSGSTYALLEDHEGYIWFGTEETGLYRLNPENSKIQAVSSLITNDTELSYPQVVGLTEDHQNRLWISTSYGLNMLDLKTYELKSYMYNKDDPTSLFDDAVNAVYETFDGLNYQIWIGTSWGGLDRYNPADDNFVHHGFQSGINPDYPETGAVTIIQASENRFWVGTDSEGILILNTHGELIDQARRSSNNDTSLPDNIIQTLYDDNDIIWIGTSGGGASKYLRNRKKFSNISYSPQVPSGLHDDRILRIKPDKLGNFWIATWSEGLSYYNPSENSFRTFQHDPNDESSLSDNTLQDILVDKDNNLWVVSASTSIDLLRSGSTKFEHFKPGKPDDPSWFQSEYILSLYEDRDGYIWLGTWDGGFIRLDPETMAFKTFTTPSVNDVNLGNLAFLSTFQDSKGVFWLGAENEGLLAFNPDDQSLRQFKTSPGTQNSLPNDDVMYIYEDRDGFFWIATYGGGLSKFNPVANTFENFDSDQGLSSESIYAIFEDKNGFLWMSTNNGIARFDKQTETFKNYHTADGVLSREFNPGACMDQNGRIYFGGIKGITHFDPLEIVDNQNVPPVQFIGLSIMNQEVQVNKLFNGRYILRKSITEIPALTLLPGDLFFSIRFAALDYYHSPSNEYMYYLEGFDNSWHYNGHQREVTLTNLPSGDFTLHVKGSNNDGVWNEEGVSIPIMILPQFYETWWFLLGIATIIGLAIIMVHRLRTSHLIRRSEEMKRHNIMLNTEVESQQQAHRFAKERADYFHAVLSQSPIPMAIHDVGGGITNLNASWIKWWGVSDKDMFINSYDIESDEFALQLDLPKHFKRTLEGRVVEQAEVQFSDADGEKRILHILLYPLKGEDNEVHHVMISLDDVTMAVNQRNLIEKSLKDKELLIKEVHHRVKNNLQIIVSLIALQKTSVDYSKTLQTLEEFRNRVNSMALVHDSLYKSDSLDRIGIQSYISSLIEELKIAFGVSEKAIEIETDVHHAKLTAEMAVPCGLMINELVTNALKYAFPDPGQNDKLISVSLIKLSSNDLVLTVADNGVGFEQTAEWDSVSSLGLYLVKILGEQQLRGKVKFIQEGGSKISITFPLPD